MPTRRNHKVLFAIHLVCHRGSVSGSGQHRTVLIEAWRLTFGLELSGMSEEMCPPKSRAWTTLAVDLKSLKARQAAEVQMLWEIRQALRRGGL